MIFRAGRALNILLFGESIDAGTLFIAGFLMTTNFPTRKEEGARLLELFISNSRQCSMTAFTSFFVRSECWSVVSGSTLTSSSSSPCCAVHRSSTIVGTRTEKSKASPDLHSFVSILRLGCLLLHPQRQIGRAVRTCEAGSPGPVRGWVSGPGQGPEEHNLGLDGRDGRVCGKNHGRLASTRFGRHAPRPAGPGRLRLISQNDRSSEQGAGHVGT